jgi:hypothetical protein
MKSGTPITTKRSNSNHAIGIPRNSKITLTEIELDYLTLIPKPAFATEELN